jgi:hypothetical protein
MYSIRLSTLPLMPDENALFPRRTVIFSVPGNQLSMMTAWCGGMSARDSLVFQPPTGGGSEADEEGI